MEGEKKKRRISAPINHRVASSVLFHMSPERSTDMQTRRGMPNTGERVWADPFHLSAGCSQRLILQNWHCSWVSTSLVCGLVLLKLVLLFPWGTGTAVHTHTKKMTCYSPDGFLISVYHTASPCSSAGLHCVLAATTGSRFILHQISLKMEVKIKPHPL